MIGSQLTGQNLLCWNYLVQCINNRMVDTAEVGLIEDWIPLIQASEFEYGVILPAPEIMKAYWRAADEMIDSYQNNERETEQSEAEMEASIQRWERMRPDYRRRQELGRKLCK